MKRFSALVAILIIFITALNLIEINSGYFVNLGASVMSQVRYQTALDTARESSLTITEATNKLGAKKAVCIYYNDNGYGCVAYLNDSKEKARELADSLAETFTGMEYRGTDGIVSVWRDDTDLYTITVVNFLVLYGKADKETWQSNRGIVKAVAPETETDKLMPTVLSLNEFEEKSAGMNTCYNNPAFTSNVKLSYEKDFNPRTLEGNYAAYIDGDSSFFTSYLNNCGIAYTITGESVLLTRIKAEKDGIIYTLSTSGNISVLTIGKGMDRFHETD